MASVSVVLIKSSTYNLKKLKNNSTIKLVIML